MLRVLLLVALATIASTHRVFTINSDLDGEWQAYLKYHNKQYQYGEELAR